MSVPSVRVLTEAEFPLLARFVEAHPSAAFTQSGRWIEAIARSTGAEARHLGAFRDGALCGVLPAFASADRGLGRVLNSLPFFGSHGGVLVDEIDPPGVARALLAEFDATAQRLGCVSATVILNPFDAASHALHDSFPATFADERIIQALQLPSTTDALMGCFTSKRRNNVRAAEKSGLTVELCSDAATFDWIRTAHETTMGGKGGVTKPPAFFEWCREAAAAGFCQVYCALWQGRMAAASINFRHGDVIEYSVPVHDLEFSRYNPLVLLIHRAMLDGIATGARWFNFGGTWKSQESLYGFKQQFGAVDLPYRYLTRIYDDRLLDADRADLVRSFPYFYALPFDRLRSAPPQIPATGK